VRLTRGRWPMETCDGPVLNDLGHSSGDTPFSQAAPCLGITPDRRAPIT
jgi:hypothetical protein